MTVANAAVRSESGEPNEFGYRSFTLGQFHFSRDEYFAYVNWPTGRHVMSVDAFLRALQRDVAWEFFYGIVNFDGVVGTMNHYGTVDLFAGRYNDAYRRAELDHVENIETSVIKGAFAAMLSDWTNHSARSLPWMIGRMYSSVVGQYRDSRQTLTTLGFQVTGDLDR